MQRRFPLTVFLLFTLFSAIQAQKAQQISDFSGTWRLKQTYWFGFIPSQKEKETLQITLVISQDIVSVKIKDSGVQPDGKPYTDDKIYYFDGRGESNSTPSGQFIEQTKTSLKKNELKILGSVIDVASKKLVTSFKEKFSISKDHEKLIWDREQNPLSGNPAMSSVFTGCWQTGSSFTFERVP